MAVSRRLVVFLSTAVMCLMPAACGGDEADSSGRTDSSKPIDATLVTFEVTDHSVGKTTSVRIDGPESIKAGLVKLSLKNNSDQNPHDAQILRVEGNHTAKETIAKTIGGKEGAPIPDWITDGGGVGTVNPGERTTVVQAYRPGSYYLLDSETADFSHKLHAYNGGVAKFTVTGKGGGQLPETEAKITADEYEFRAEGIKPGMNRLTFKNAGYQLHHLIAFPYRGNATYKEVVGDLFGTRDPDSGPIPINRELGLGTAVIDGGQSQIVEMDFEKGKYALVCFVADREGGASHLQQGMITELDVK